MRVRKRTEGADHLMGLHIEYDITRTLVLSIDTGGMPLPSMLSRYDDNCVHCPLVILCGW
jgi:hypothetical protein